MLRHMVSENMTRIANAVRLHLAALDESIERLKAEFGENSPAYKAMNHRKRQYLEKHILKFLARE
jgi:DEAD/DEAH box helicase domain-containing protein